MLCCYDNGDIEIYDQEGVFRECGKSRKKEGVTRMKEDKVFLYTILTSSVVATTILSNLAAIKITSIVGLPTDCGFIFYPATFLLMDLLNRKFGLKIANFVTFISTLLSLMLSLIMMLIIVKMPVYAEWTGQEAFETTFNMGFRIAGAAAIVYLTSHIVDNFVFAYLNRENKMFIKNSFLSSVIAQAIDSVLFIMFAFYGTISAIGLVKQVLFGTIIGIIVQVVYSAICLAIQKLFKLRNH